MTLKRFAAPLIFCLMPVVVFLQSTILAQALPGDITLNLCFFLVVAAGYYLGAAGGTTCGLWGGALIGAAAGALAVPFALLYGTVGWLAGRHIEKRPRLWTLPLVSIALFTLLLSAESWLSLFTDGFQPPLVWKLKNLGWTGLAGLAFLGLPGLRKRC